MLIILNLRVLLEDSYEVATKVNISIKGKGKVFPSTGLGGP
jgi:hypothetical protein